MAACMRGDVAGLAFDGGGEDEGLVAEGLGLGGGGIDGEAVAADDDVVDAVEAGVAGLGRFVDAGGFLEPGADGRRACLAQRPYLSMTAQASAKVEGSGAVGPEPMTSRGSPMTSERMSARTLAGAASASELAALDGGEVLADGVDFVDVGAAGEQEARGVLLFGEGDGCGGQGQERGAAAGDEADDKIARAGVAGDFGDAPGAVDAALIRDGVAALVEFDAAEGARSGRP